MNGTLSVNSATILNSTLSVRQPTTLANTLSVGNDVELATNLSVQGNTEMNGTLSVNSATILNSTLSVRQPTTLANTLSVGNNVELTTNLSVQGNTEMNGTLSVTGNTFFRGELSLGNHLEVNNTLSVTQGVQFGSTLSVGNNMYIDATNDASLFVNTIKDYTNQDGSGTLTIDVDTLVVKGNLDVGGTYNTIDISTSTIAVEDKLIILSTSSNYDGTNDVDSDVTDGASVNDSAGIKIAGKPSNSDIISAGFTGDYSQSNLWEKSFKWNINQGMPSLGYLHSSETTTVRDNESFWELKGGALHLSADKINDSGEEITVKYGFRINANDELEIIKKVGDAASKRVAKFGITSAF